MPLQITSIDQSIPRTLHSEDDEDWFAYTAGQDSIILFLANGIDGLDTRMEIYNSDKSEAASNDDYGDSYDAGIVYPVENGKTIYINVFGYDGETGSYSLEMQEFQIDDESMEPNNSMSQAYLIEPSEEAISGFFMSENDSDWYKVVVPSGGKSLHIETGGDFDTYLNLYDDEDLIDENDDDGSDYNARINRVLSQGTYYIEVTELNEETGPYSLRITLRDPPQPDSYEPDNAMKDARELTVGSPQNRTFSDSDDEDWVYFDVARSGDYVVSAFGEDTSFDTYIELYDEDGDYIDEDDDGGEYYDSRLSIELDPGRYYILVTTLDEFGYPESYTLSVEE
jgi:hypothetical protein